MGVAVSSWPLARAVSRRGQLGVVSSAGIDAVMTRRLQLGDPDGSLARAFAAFPFREAAERIWDRYFVPGGIVAGKAFKSKPLPSINQSTFLTELMVLANFVEVWLAKEGHSGVVGINLLEKIQLPTLPSLYGAMLAEVDFVLMGAGIPRAIPGILDGLAAGEDVEMELHVKDLEPGVCTTFASKFTPFKREAIKRPKFLAIVASASLAQILAKKCKPPVDGFVIEGPTAGGHNAPPRGALQLDEHGEPIYGERDVPELEKFREFGLPFWLAGSYGTHDGLKHALAEGACGIQVGTAFAFCRESGIRPDIKATAIAQSLLGDTHVFTDPKASPTGFPFKVVDMQGTVSDPEVRDRRKRVCDLGYLRETYLQPDGKLGYRCPGEPVEDYVRKGGDPADTVGRLCVCNGLTATVGLGQVQKGMPEPPLVTAGDDLSHLSRYMKPGAESYSADDVLDVLLGVDQQERFIETMMSVMAGA